MLAQNVTGGLSCFHNDLARKPLPLGRGGSAVLLSKLGQKCCSLLNKHQFFETDAGRKSNSVQRSDVKGTRRTASENDPDSSFALHFVEKAEALDKVWHLVEFSNPSLENRTLMDLTVVLSRLLLEEEISSSKRIQISRNTEGVGAMRLGQAMDNALVLRQIAVGVLDRQFGVRPTNAVK